LLVMVIWAETMETAIRAVSVKRIVFIVLQFYKVNHHKDITIIFK